MPRPVVSLVTTVRDEEDTIAALLDSVVEQTRPPDEVVVNDCHCTDRTMEIVATYKGRLPLRTTAGGWNIPQGRNTAIEAARGDLIASTDAGLRLDPCWLEEIVAPLERGEAELAAGFFRPAPHTPFEQVLGAIAYPRLEEVDRQRFLPAGQSMAFTRELWQTVGGFPERLPYCEDLVFTRRALRAGYRKVFVPQALVHFRPRSSVGAFYRQYRNYAYGDGLAGLWPRRHALRYASYASGVALLVAGWWWPALWAAFLLGGAMYLGPYYRRLGPVLRKLPPRWRAGSLFLVPFLRLTGDVAKMIGYPQGWWERRGGGQPPGKVATGAPPGSGPERGGSPAEEVAGFVGGGPDQAGSAPAPPDEPGAAPVQGRELPMSAGGGAVLNEQELARIDEAPEESLRLAVARGALALDPLTADLPPRVAQMVRRVVAGERRGGPETAAALGGTEPAEQLQSPLSAAELEELAAAVESGLGGEGVAGGDLAPYYPRLWGLVERELLTVKEAYRAARAIDRALGRYLTGTKYAAP